MTKDGAEEHIACHFLCKREGEMGNQTNLHSFAKGTRSLNTLYLITER